MKERTFRRRRSRDRGGQGRHRLLRHRGRHGEGERSAAQEVRTIGRGDYFGEIGLIADIDRTATITAESDLRCFGMTSWDFRPLVESNASIAWKMLQIMAQRLKEAQANSSRGSAREEAEERELPAWSLPPGSTDRIRLDFAVARARHARVGARGRDRQGRARLHPRQRRRAGSSAGRQGRRAPSRSRRTRTASRSRRPTRRVTSAGTARRAPGSSAASRPSARCTASACSAPATRARAPMLLGGLRWAVEQGFDVINMSLSTTKRQFAEVLHDLADTAYFNRTILVASAHNMPVESYPWRFSSVISVGSHARARLAALLLQPEPAGRVLRARRRRRARVDRTARRSARRATASRRRTCPGICALVLSKHPELTPFQLKSVLHLIADNVGGGET